VPRDGQRRPRNGRAPRGRASWAWPGVSRSEIRRQPRGDAVVGAKRSDAELDGRRNMAAIGSEQLAVQAGAASPSPHSASRRPRLAQSTVRRSLFRSPASTRVKRRSLQNKLLWIGITGERSRKCKSGPALPMSADCRVPLLLFEPVMDRQNSTSRFACHELQIAIALNL